MKKETYLGAGMIRQKRAQVVLQELKKLFPEAKTILQYSNNLELLIAVILSAQTTDVQVNKVTEKLFQKYKKLEDYVRALPEEFERDISSVNFYRAKAKNILKTVHLLHEKHGGKVPSKYEEIIELPGVGRKTANVVLGIAHGVVEGIAVDTHVHRLAQKFGLTSHDDAEKIEKDLMKILPKSEWLEFTFRVIAYGRKYSPARLKEDTDPISVKLKKLYSP